MMPLLTPTLLFLAIPAWGSLYRTVSRPFDQPDSGKIAVKVINHYRDEVLKVFEA